MLIMTHIFVLYFNINKTGANGSHKILSVLTGMIIKTLTCALCKIFVRNQHFKIFFV